MWHPVKQNTDEPCPCCGKTWMDGLRPGKVTGSTLEHVMAWHDKPVIDKKTKMVLFPKWGEPAQRDAVEIAVIESGGEPTVHDYTNNSMERGKEQEPIARSLYEAEYFCNVTNGGFFDNNKTGCSPDGLVSTNGVIEIKSVISHVHYNCIKFNHYDPKYKWQLLHNLKETGREWIDFVSYCSSFPEGKRLFVNRIYAKDVQDEFNIIEKRLEDFFRLVDEIKDRIVNA